MSVLTIKQFAFPPDDIGVFNPDFQGRIDRYDIGYVNVAGKVVYTDVLLFCERLRAQKESVEPTAWANIYGFVLRGRAAIWWNSLRPVDREILKRQTVENFCVKLKRAFLQPRSFEKVVRYTYTDDYSKRNAPIGPHLYRHLVWPRGYTYLNNSHQHLNVSESHPCDLLGPNPKFTLKNLLITGRFGKERRSFCLVEVLTT